MSRQARHRACARPSSAPGSPRASARAWAAPLARLLLLVAAVLAGAAPVAAEPPPSPDSVDLVPHGQPEEIYLRAATAYDEGQHARAVDLYEALIARGVDSSAVWYNLGNAAMRGGALGRAVLAYRHAQARSPRDADIAANLAFARASATDAVAPPVPGAVARTLLFWHYLLSPAERAWALLVLNAVLWSAVAWTLVRRRRRVGLIAAAAVPTALLAASVAVHLLAPTRLAVVTSPAVDVRAGTSHDAVLRFTLHEGTEARWVATTDGWARIELADGKDGWASIDDLTIAELP